MEDIRTWLSGLHPTLQCYSTCFEAFGIACTDDLKLFRPDDLDRQEFETILPVHKRRKESLG